MLLTGNTPHNSNSFKMGECEYLVVFFAALLATLPIGSSNTVISSPLITDWGVWGDMQKCPVGRVVQGFQLQTEPTHTFNDDTALNSLKLFCGDPNKLDTTAITSSQGAFGKWGKVYSCFPGILTGFQMRSEPNKGSKDDSAANNVRFFCSNLPKNDYVEGDGMSWGDWSTAQHCPSGEGICAIQTQIEPYKHKEDDTMLNNVKFECCSFFNSGPDPFSSKHLNQSIQCQDCQECPKCPDCICPNNDCLSLSQFRSEPTCPNPCQPCLAYHPCPDKICPPCNCQNSERSCPNPCRECPHLTCGESKSNCASCPPCELRSEECICDPRGTASMSGSQCICKVNVEGAKCDKCKKGYFALSSTRPEGCLACFCSGLTDSCSNAIYYLANLTTSKSVDCSIELTNDDHTLVYSHGLSGFTFDGSQATFSRGANRRLFWSLPACMKGNRVTSYGGLLSFSRMCSGSGNQLGADHELILVSGSGATVFWTSFETQRCTSNWIYTEVLLAETAYWSSWKGEQNRRATRADIMEVLADIQLILIRATFTTNTITTSIRNVTLSTVSQKVTRDGIALQVESCRCPIGYNGLSCESCAPGYYRDMADTSKSVFGACKLCPCGSTANGCYLDGREVICNCMKGFSGPLCMDEEFITINIHPFKIRGVEGSKIDVTCSFMGYSKRRLLIRLGLEGKQGNAEETMHLTKQFLITKGMQRIACEVIDDSDVTWAVVYSAIEIISGMDASNTIPRASNVDVERLMPPRVIAVIPTETFICINETETVTLSCEIHAFGQQRIQMEWRREGSQRVIGIGKDITFHNVAVDDSGTYICSASDGDVVGVGQIALMVHQLMIGMRNQYPINITNSLENKMVRQHGGDFPNHPYQSDQPFVVDAGHPKAQVEPREITAKVGDTVILKCTASGEDPLKMYWKSGTHDYLPSHARLSHQALVFKYLTEEEAGDYFCVAYNHLGTSSAKATIILDKSTDADDSY